MSSSESRAFSLASKRASPGYSGKWSSAAASSQSRTSGIRSSLKPSLAGKEFEDIRQLFDLLQEARIPGPKLLRLKKELCVDIGNGTEGVIYAASQEYDTKLKLCEGNSDPFVRQSACELRLRVVKQLKNDKGLEYQVDSALNEVRRLCHKSFKNQRGKFKRGIVNLQGWALCLDSLEDAFDSPRLPLLILERAESDLEVFIQNGAIAKLKFQQIWLLAQDIASGLAAIHNAEPVPIAHCDLKPANILLFRSQKDDVSAKICDFGSALDAGKPIGSKYPNGSPAWKPPEYHCEEIDVDPRKCDIFSYGLLVWAMFLGTADSPGIGLESEVRDLWGQQLYYTKAREQISRSRWATKAPPTEENTVDEQRYEIPLFRSLLQLFGIEVQDTTLPLASTNREVEIAHDFGPHANQLLGLLRLTLNDNPVARVSAELACLESTRYISQVIPPSELRGRPQSMVSRDIAQPRKEGNSTVTLANQIRYHAKKWFPFLRPRNARLRTYEAVHRVFVDILGLQPDNLQQGVLERHSHSSMCRPWTIREEYFLEKHFSHIIYHERSTDDDIEILRQRSMLSDDALYAFARVRGMFPKCCWENVFRCEPELLDFIEKELRRAAQTRCDEIAVWTFRGRTADDIVGEDVQPYFNFLQNKASTSNDFPIIFRMQLLLERNFFLGQSLTPGSPWTIFYSFLLRLRRPEMAVLICKHFRRIASSNDASAENKLFYSGHLDDSFEGIPDHHNVAEGFATTTALHDAVRAANYAAVEILVSDGFNVTVRDADGMTPLDLALSDITDAKIQGFTTKLPTDINDWISNSQQQKKQDAIIESSRIKIRDFLEQHTPGRRSGDKLPLHWQAFSVTSEQEMVAYRDLSIESESVPITFHRPNTGLLHDDRIAIACRTVAGASQTYRLNPIRFIQRFRFPNQRGPGHDVVSADNTFGQMSKTVGSRSIRTVNKGFENKPTFPQSTLHPAKEISSQQSCLQITMTKMEDSAKEIFTDNWYQSEIMATRERQLDASLDERDWYRSIANITRHVSARAFAFFLGFTDPLAFFNLQFIFWPLQVASWLLNWTINTQLAFGFIAIPLLIAELSRPTNYAGRHHRSIVGWRTLCIGLTTIADFTIGCFYVTHGEYKLPLALALGNIIANPLLGLGSSVIAGGIKYKQQVFNITSSMTTMRGPLLGSVFAVFTFTFWETRFESSPAATAHGLSVLSRVLAVVFLIVGFTVMLFRLRTHEDLFIPYNDEEEYEDEGLSGSDRRSGWIISILLIPICLAISGAAFVSNLEAKGPHFQTIAATFILPLATKLPQSVIWMQSAWEDDLDSVLDWTLGVNEAYFLFIIPLWIVLSWVLQTPMIYLFDALQTVLLATSSWISILIVQNGRIEWFEGLALVSVYAIFCIAIGTQLK